MKTIDDYHKAIQKDNLILSDLVENHCSPAMLEFEELLQLGFSEDAAADIEVCSSTLRNHLVEAKDFAESVQRLFKANKPH